MELISDNKVVISVCLWYQDKGRMYAGQQKVGKV